MIQPGPPPKTSTIQPRLIPPPRIHAVEISIREELTDEIENNNSPNIPEVMLSYGLRFTELRSEGQNREHGVSEIQIICYFFRTLSSLQCLVWMEADQL